MHSRRCSSRCYPTGQRNHIHGIAVSLLYQTDTWTDLAISSQASGSDEPTGWWIVNCCLIPVSKAYFISLFPFSFLSHPVKHFIYCAIWFIFTMVLTNAANHKCKKCQLSATKQHLVVVVVSLSITSITFSNDFKKQLKISKYTKKFLE